MGRKSYKISKTKKKIMRDNNLVESPQQSDILYDFSLFDQISFGLDYERELIQEDLMRHHGISWYNDPIPTIIIYNKWIHYVGQIRTVPHRVWREDGKRICVIVEVVSIEISRQERKSVYEEFLNTKQTYIAKSGNVEYDIDMAA